MYKCLFDVIGLRFPLSSFEVGVVNHLRICPSQLHPLSWELVGLLPGVNGLDRNHPYPSFLASLVSSVLVQMPGRTRASPEEDPKEGGETAEGARLSTSGCRDDGSSPRGDPRSGDAFPRVPRFRRSWPHRHFKRKPRAYFFNLDELSPSEVVLYQQLTAYFAKLKGDFINTKNVLTQENRLQRSVLFAEMTDDLDYLHQMAGRFPVVNDSVGANVGTATDIEDALHQLTDLGDDQGNVELSLDLEGCRKKRHERDVDEGDPSSKKC
ncbi:hypothetical protein A2U01_0017584, partial [Trifolium medium]|nr:hypothetical protein [Trifolium medium]